MQGGFAIIWGAEFVQYDLAINDPDRDTGSMREWDVSRAVAGANWSEIASPEMRVFWEWTTHWSEGTDYPQDLEWRFESGRVVYLSALEIRPGGTWIGQQDHVTVFFGPEAAEFRIGPYGAAPGPAPEAAASEEPCGQNAVSGNDYPHG